MRKVTGQSRREYHLDQKSRKSSMYGEIYKVEASANVYVKILNDCSKAKQQEVEGFLSRNEIYNTTDKLIDLAYSRGNFVGYVYYHVEPVSNMELTGTQTVPTDLEPVKQSKKREVPKSPWESTPVKIGIFVLFAVLIGVLNIYVIYEKYLEIIAVSFGTPVLNGCILLGLQGVTSFVLGLAMAVFLLFTLSTNGTRLGTVSFVLIGVISMIAGIALADFLLVLLVLLFCGAVGLVKALLPTVIAIAVMWLLVKYIFSSIFRR